MTDGYPAYAVENNFTFFRGDDWSQSFTLSSGGTPINLTGASVAAKAVKGQTLTTIAVNTASLSTGTFILSLARSVTSEMKGVYKYDVEIIDGSDKKLTRIYGTLTVTPDVKL